MYPDERDSTKARICRRSMGRERELHNTAGNSTDDSSQQKMLGCSSTTSKIMLRAELGMYPLNTNKRREKVEMAKKSKEHAKKEVASHG